MIKVYSTKVVFAFIIFQFNFGSNQIIMKALITLLLLFLFNLTYAQSNTLTLDDYELLKSKYSSPDSAYTTLFAQIPGFQKWYQNQQLPSSMVSVNDTILFTGGSYEFIHSIPKTLSPELILDLSEQSEIKETQKVNVLYELNGRVYYKYWLFEEDEEDKEKNSQIYTIDKTKFMQLVRPLYRRYKGATFGAYTVPFRLRGLGKKNAFDFESSLSLQANLVFGFGSRYAQRSFFDASFGVGLTGISLNEGNSSISEDRTASAFTISFGGVMKPAEYANIGIFLGWDLLGQKDNEVDWIYNRKPWLGIGLNINFTQVKTNKPPKNSQ